MWNASRVGYYADMVTIPILIFAALLSALSYHGVTAALVLTFAVGVVLWTFLEYAIHRWVFHRLLRRDHWLHHIRPAAYITIPSWQTGIAAVTLLGTCLGSFGLDAGVGFFTGLASGYLAYIIAHDRIHHSKDLGNGWGYWHEMARRHWLHHSKGVEKNFGVVIPLWDIALGTYLPASPP